MNLVEMAILGTGMLGCVVIAVQDFKSRSVHVLAFALLFLPALAFQLLLPEMYLLKQVLVSLGFLALVLLLTWLYFRLRHGGKFVNEKLGLGDIVMLGIVPFWFSLQGFVIYFVSGIVLS